MSLDRREMLERLSLGAGSVALAGLVPGVARAAPEQTDLGAFPRHPTWKLFFVSHLTTSPLFVPLQYGIQDACALVGCTYSWTGSARGDTGEVVEAVQAAIESRAGGIALPLVDPEALSRPVAAARDAGIPVVAYHADASDGDRRLAFVGPNAYSAGLEIGDRIGKLVRRGEVALLVAERKVGPVERRLAGTIAGVRRTAPAVRLRVLATTRDPYEASDRIDRYVKAEEELRGLFPLELVPSEGTGRAVLKHDLRAKGVRAGGYGVLPATLDLIRAGQVDFTLDEQPYLQGFVPAVQLFLSRLSGGLVSPSDTQLALRFVTRANLDAYLAKTRYEGSSSKQRYPIS